MAETTERPKLADTIRQLEQRPFDLTLWQNLESALKEQNDPFSLKTLTVIVRGIKALNGRVPDSRKIRDTFCRLARSYNNPMVLLTAAKHYLQDLNLPSVAKEHLVLCKTLGVSEVEAAPLIAQADAEIKKAGANSLVTVSNKSAVRTIRKTGKLSLLPKTPDASKPEDPLAAPIILDKSGLERPLESAAACILSGDLVSSRRYLKQGSPDSNPQRYWELWTELGNAHYDKNQYMDARSAYYEACNVVPDNVISQFNLGTGMLVTGDFDGALKCFQKADDIESYEPKVLCNVGAAYFLQDEYSRAEEILRETVRIKPDYVRALNTLSSVLGAMDKLDESLEICEQILQIHPEHGEACLKKGIICLNHGELESAVECLTIAAGSPEFQVDAHCYLSQALAGTLQTHFAEEALEGALQMGQVEIEVLCNCWKAIGRSWRKQDETARAVAALQKACQFDPRDAEAWYELGVTYGKAKADSYAKECFQNYFRLAPDAAKRTTVDKLLESTRAN